MRDPGCMSLFDIVGTISLVNITTTKPVSFGVLAICEGNAQMSNGRGVTIVPLDPHMFLVETEEEVRQMFKLCGTRRERNREKTRRATGFPDVLRDEGKRTSSEAP